MGKVDRLDLIRQRRVALRIYSSARRGSSDTALPLPEAWAGLDSPEAIEAPERAAAELLNGSNLEPRDLVRGLLANEGDCT
jgi:hypothetical protein